MTAAATKQRKKPGSNSDKKSLGLWIDPTHLPNARSHFVPPEKSEQHYVVNRYLELADLVLKEPICEKKRKIG